MGKTVPLSVRISHEDAEYLARLETENSKTPSDKVRAIIAERRRLSLDEQSSYVQVCSWLENILNPTSLTLKEIQNQEEQHSELIRIVLERLPELFAYILATGNVVQSKQDLAKLERELSERVFRLIESILRLGVTEKSPCIDKKAISSRIGPSMEILEVIQNRLKKEKGEQT